MEQSIEYMLAHFIKVREKERLKYHLKLTDTERLVFISNLDYLSIKIRNCKERLKEYE